MNGIFEKIENAFGKLGLTPLEALALFIILSFSFGIAFNGLFEKQDFLLPTYDNSMLHAGRARIVLETGQWAEKELVFGGNTTSYHSPAYPVLVAGVSLATGLNWVWAIKIVGMLFSILFPIAFFLLAKEASGGNWMSGIAAAFLALNSYNLMSWGTRTTPISFGVILVVFLLYFVLKKMRAPALLCAITLALNHQPSLLVAVVSLFLFAVATTLSAIWASVWETLRISGSEVGEKAKAFFYGTIEKMDWAANFAGLLAFGTYMLWHVRQTGLSCLGFKCLPQASAHEFGKGIDLQEHFFKFPQAPAIMGVLVVALDSKIDRRAKMLLFSWLAAALLLVKNDAVFALFGGSGGVFTERFLTYLDEAAAVFGGIAIGWIFAFLAGGGRREKRETPAPRELKKEARIPSSGRKKSG